MRNHRAQKLLGSVFLSLFVFPVLTAPAFDESDIKMNADKVNFDYETGVSHFSENVNIEYRGAKLFADEATVSSKDKKAKASGHVLIVDDNKIYCCESIDYDFESKKGLMLNGSTMESAWILTGDRVNQVADKSFIVEHCRASVCGNDHPHFYMTSQRVEVESGKYLIAHDALFWMGPVPIFYWPYYKKRLDRHDNLFNVRLGSNNLFGGYVFTRFRYPVSDDTDVDADLKYYSKRGVGLEVGSKTETEDSRTRFQAFYIKDKKFKPTLSQEKEGELIRNRLTLQNSTRFSDWQSTLDLNRLSDADVLYDFYKNESDDTLQVDHQYRLSKTDEFESMGAYIRLRSNDFNSALERMPEFYYNVVPFEIVDYSNVYFSTTNSVSFLKKREILADAEEPSLVRGYTRNALTYVNKFFGWLSFTPEAGLETVGYSKSLSPVSLTVVDPLLTPGLTATTPATDSKLYDGDSQVRWAPFYGMHFSTNLWKRFDTDETFLGYTHFRHVLTPGLGYFLQPEPSVLDEEIIQLDEIDLRPKKQELTFELISRWQAKDLESTGEAQTLFNTRYSIPYDLNATTDPWGNLNVESEWRPTKDFKADVRLSYDFENSELPSLRTDLSWRFENIFGASLGYWYRNVEGSLITPELSLNIGNDWFVRAYCHYNDETQVFERKELAFIKSMHCLDLGVRVYERDYLDEKGFYITISPKDVTSAVLGFSE